MSSSKERRSAVCCDIGDNHFLNVCPFNETIVFNRKPAFSNGINKTFPQHDTFRKVLIGSFTDMKDSFLNMIKGGIVVFDGTIGVGKSTSIEETRKELVAIGEEVYKCDEPIKPKLLDDYIADQETYALLFQMTILKDRTDMLIKAINVYKERKGKITLLLDRMTFGGDNVFGYANYQMGFMSPLDYAAYVSFAEKQNQRLENAFNEVKQTLGFGNIITIYLKIDAIESMNRIKARGNMSEISGYTMHYLDTLVQNYNLLYPDTEDRNYYIIDWAKCGMLLSLLKEPPSSETIWEAFVREFMNNF